MSTATLAIYERARAIRKSAWLERHLDELLAVLVLIAGLIWLATSKVDGPAAAQVLIVAGLAVAMSFRRRSPLGWPTSRKRPGPCISC